MLVEVLISHTERAVVRVGDVFVKVDTDVERFERERVALQSARIPRPELLWYRDGETQVLALAAIQGAPLALLGQASPHPPAAWEAAGSTARLLHGQTVPAGLAKPSRYLLEDLDELEAWLLSKEIASRRIVAEHTHRARAARGAATAETFIHGDFQPAHIFMTADNEVAGVVDWGDAGVGDAHYDLAVLTVGNSENLGAVIKGYGGDVDRDRIAGYWSWRRLGSIRWMIEHGFDPSDDLRALDPR